MKYRNFLLLVMALLGCVLSCEDELETSPPSQEVYVSNFGISSARRYFESTAKDLSYLSFRDDRPQTRAGLSTEAELVPQWEKARFSSNDEVELVEVPLHTGADMYSTTRSVQSGEQVMSKSFPSAMRLIVARRTSGDTLMFVVTLVPTLGRSPHPVKSMNNFRYLGGGDFTGKVFCSTLEGRFVEVCQYVNGHRAGLLKATTRSQLEARGVDLTAMSYESITWSPASVVLNEQYGDEGLNPGGGSGMCSFHPSYPAESCPYCIEEVIVRSCQYCGARLEAGEVCDCRCDVCGSYPCKCCFYCGTYPCICESDCEICRPLPCMACEKCGSHFCFGTCEEEPDSGNTCPYGKCDGNPCTCCPICEGPCWCSGCHHNPCVCCLGEKCLRCGGYIGIMTRSSNCPPCTCPQITITLNKTLVDLGTKIKIDVSIGNTTANCNYISYSLTQGGQVGSTSFNHSQLSYETIVRDVGEYEVSVEAGFDGLDGWYESENTVKFTCQFPSIYTIKEIPVVRAGMADAWAKTLADADESGCREYGGVIMLNTTTDKENDYSFVLKTGKWCEYEEEKYSVNLDYQENNHGFKYGGNFCVMLFHTHPPLWNCPSPKINRILGPSTSDIEDHGYFPAIVFDFDNQYVDVLNSAVPKEKCVRKEYIYGVERRKN